MAAAAAAAPRGEEAKERGNAAFKAKNYHLAVKHFSEACEADPQNAAYLSNRAAAYIELGKQDGSFYELAISDADKAIALRPEWGKGYLRKGTAQLMRGQIKEAVSTFALGMSKDPTDATLMQSLTAAQKKLAKRSGDAEAADQERDEDEEKAPPKPAGETKYVIGIDLGTTYSCVGVWKDGGVQILANEDGERTLPSWITVTEEGVFTGNQARALALRYPQYTLYDVKRFIGQRFSDSGVQKDIKNYAFKVVRGPDDKPMVELPVAPGKTKLFAPEELSSFVLARLKRVAENYLKQPVTDAVITVPAYFSDTQRAATKDAGAIAGLNVLRIINEPTAAALSYGLDNVPSKGKVVHVLVFDLGGGTFDVSVLRIEGGAFEVLATGGDTRLGGEDFDHNVVDMVWAEVEKQGFLDAALSPQPDKMRQRLRIAVEKAKRQLSNAMSAEVHVEALAGERNFTFKLERQTFERVNQPLFERCIDTVRRVVKDARIKTEEVDEIVLVGGSTRIPKIQAMLQQYFGGKELCKTVNPDEAVAYGAAVQGAILSGQRFKGTEDLVLMDVTPLSLGIETTGRVMSVIIPRNSRIPCVKTQVYTTEENYQKGIDIAVYEGERLKSDENNLLGQFSISGIELAKRGEPKIDVTFSLDSNGILTVSAKDQKTGAEAQIAITNRSRASEADVKRMVKEAEHFRRADEERVKKQQARNELEQLIYDAFETAKGLDDKKLADIIVTAAEKAQQWLEDEGESAKASDMNAQRRQLERRLEGKRAKRG